MSVARLQFVKSTGMASWLISRFGNGYWTHVDIVLPGGELLGARSDAIGGKPPGVQIRPPGYELWVDRMVIEIEASPWSLALGRGFLNKQLGKPYDRLAIVAFAMDRDWRNEGQWICSELAARYLEVSALIHKLDVCVSKVTPGACAMVASAIGRRLHATP